MIINRQSFVAAILLLLFTVNEGLRVLVFFPMASKSHSILGHGFVTHLLEAGHEVVHVTSFPHNKDVSKLKEIDVSIIGERYRAQAKGKLDAFKLKNMIGKSNIGDSLFFLYIVHDLHKQVFDEKVVLDLLIDPRERFDVVILEWFFNDFIAGIAPLFKCPLIWFGSTEAHWQVLKVIDEAPNPSFNVDLFSSSRPPLTFMERVMELWTMVKKSVVINLLIVPLEKWTYSSIFSPIALKRNVVMPSYSEAVYNGSFLLLNSHPSIGTPFRLPQNAKYIAGYHIDTKVQPLPKNLQTLMDSSKHGVIYFSMGSNLKSADMSHEMRESLLRMYGELEQTVIWKFEEDLTNVPPNVQLVKWAPQLSILSHPNLKIFITHGGQLSTTEAVNFAVPVIGIPVMGDQHVNMRSVENKGFGLSILLAEDMAPKLKNAIQEMLWNSSYKERAKQLSNLFHDRILTPGAELVHWVEYVTRTAGAPHLRSSAVDVPLYQKLYIDFIFVIAIVIFVIFILIRHLRKIYSNFKSLKEKAH